MPTPNALAVACRRTGQWLLIACLFAVLYFPATAWAASSDPDVDEPNNCAQCHPNEATTWQDSTHAHVTDTDQDGVTCETCHGTYIHNHPQEGMMKLPADASACGDCHTITYQQWHDTAHAGVGVKCISCHVPHSQATRLTGEALCVSCHRDGSEHRVHHEADVHCEDCHLSFDSDPNAPAAGVGDLRVMVGGETPDHRFKLAVESCAGCHAESIHDTVLNEATGQATVSQVSVMTERAKELSMELQDAKRTNRTLQTMSVASLGFGLGTGGVLGAIFVLVVGYVAQGRSRK